MPGVGLDTAYRCNRTITTLCAKIYDNRDGIGLTAYEDTDRGYSPIDSPYAV